MNNSEDEIVITALLKRFTEHRLPRTLDIEKKVQAGEKLSDSDLTYLEMVFNDAQYLRGLIDRHPEHHALAAKIIKLYTDITEKALENEKKK